MHYGAYDFAIDRSVPVIQPKDSSISVSRLGQRSRFSPYDIMQVNIRYCPGMDNTLAVPQCYNVLHELYFCESSDRWRHRKEKIAKIKLVGVAFDTCGGNIDVEPNERYLAVPGEAAAMDVSGPV